MRTDDLVRTLVADHATREGPVGRTFAIALVLALALATALFALMSGPRNDFATVVTDPRFVFKFVVTLTLAASAAVLVLRLASPGVEPRFSALALAAGPALLALGVLVELALIPSSQWTTKLVGQNYLICLSSIPLLSAPPLVAALMALRHGAPTRPAFAGAVAGLLAGGIGATLYAAQCTDDSPLFVATWYTITIAGVTGIGSLAGARLLRW